MRAHQRGLQSPDKEGTTVPKMSARLKTLVLMLLSQNLPRKVANHQHRLICGYMVECSYVTDVMRLFNESSVC